MAKKIRLSQKKKESIKNGFDSLTKKQIEKLSVNERRYYNIVKAFKASAAARAVNYDKIEFEGRIYRGEVVDVLVNAARSAGTTPARFVKENPEEVKNFLETTEVRLQRSAESVMTTISKYKNGKFYIDDGNGLTKVGKKESIKIIADFQNLIKSNSDIVDIRIFTRVTPNGKFVIEIPTPEEFEAFEDSDEESIEDLLEIHDIFYVKSKKKK